MPTYTDNHDLSKYSEDEEPWTHNDDMDYLDSAVPIVDTEANQSNYTAYAGALFLAEDTDLLYMGDGSSWIEIGKIGGEVANPHGDDAHDSTVPSQSDVDGKADDPHGSGSHDSTVPANPLTQDLDADTQEITNLGALNGGGPVSDGDGTERQIWVIAAGASDPAGASSEDIIFEEEES